jgi:hypothetical protein
MWNLVLSLVDLLVYTFKSIAYLQNHFMVIAVDNLCY